MTRIDSIFVALICAYLFFSAVPVAAAAARPPADASAYAAAVDFDKAGRKSEAIGQLRKALRLKPDSVPYLNMLGTLYYDLGDYTDAVKTLEAARKYAPEKVRHYYLAKSLLKLGRLEEARKAAATGSRLEPQKGRQLELIKMGERIRNYRAGFSAAKAAYAGQKYSDAASELRAARALIDTQEAKELSLEIDKATAAGDFRWLLAAASQALEKGDLPAARNELKAARQLADSDETAALGAAIEKAEIFQRHLARADAQLQEKDFKTAREEASQALALLPRDEARKKLAEIDKAEQYDQYQFHLEQAKTFLAKNADHASALVELKLAMDISATDEARQLMADVDKMAADQAYNQHCDRAGDLFRKKDYRGAIAELKAAAAIGRTAAVEARISEALMLRNKQLRDRLLLKVMSGLGLLVLLFGAARLRFRRRKADRSLAALARITDAVRLSDFRKAMLEYSGFKAAGGLTEDIPAAELFMLFSGSGAVDRLSGENVPAGYLLDYALELVRKNRSADAFLMLGDGAVLRKTETLRDFAAFVNIYVLAGELDALAAMLDRGGFGPDIYSGLAAAMLELQQHEHGVRILQAKRKFHEMQKIDTDLLFAFTAKPGA